MEKLEQNNAVVKLKEAISSKTNKPYTMVVVEVDGNEIFTKFPTKLEIIAIKTLIK
jgi:hypothetical protein